MTAVNHLCVEGADVALVAEAGQSVTFDPHGCFGEVKGGRVCELTDVMATEE